LTVVDLVHPGAGAIKALGVPVKLSDTPRSVDRAAPMLGEHNAEIRPSSGTARASSAR
jgi:crotonobetainyl-CoA:carnitine CoA-transferase CaiB-like acyl-CoA transferase